MQLRPFSSDLCRELIDKGYSHLVTMYQLNDELIADEPEIVTLEAVKEEKQKKAIPIMQVMNLPNEEQSRYYVMLRD